MIQTPSAVAASQYTSFTHNCTRNRACERAFTVPIPGVPYLQLYIDFGTAKPITADFELIDHCTGNMEQIFSSNFVVGQTPEGTWYGVFKYFNTPTIDAKTFVVWLSSIVDTGSELVERTFFSEMYSMEDCEPLMKVKACQPENASVTGFDINGLYYGFPQNEDFLGYASVRYFHIAYVRWGKVREFSNRATFVSTLTRTMRSEVEKIHQLETELVPKFYKDVLLAIYARGVISVNDGQKYVVNELAIDPINDDDLTWKPFVNLKETFKLYFGCDESECEECCSPIILSATVNGSGGGSGSDASESVPEPVDPETSMLTFFAYAGGQFTFTLSNAIPSTNTVISDAGVIGYINGACSGPFDATDTINLSNPLTIPAGATVGNQMGLAPMDCSINTWQRVSSITVNGESKASGQTIMIGGTLVTVVINSGCAGLYSC